MTKTIEQVKQYLNHAVRDITKNINDKNVIITNEKECYAVLEYLHGLLDYIDESGDANESHHNSK